MKNKQHFSKMVGRGAASFIIAGALTTGMCGTALATVKIGSDVTPMTAQSILLTTASVRAGSAGPDFLGITNMNYDFQPSHTAGAGDPYPYYAEVSGAVKGWGNDLNSDDQFNRLAVWGSGVNVNANPYYQNLLADRLLDNDITDNKGALPAGYAKATTYHSNPETSSWGDVTVDNKYAGTASADIIYGANKFTNWGSNFSEYTQTSKVEGYNPTYTNNDSTNIWTQMYSIEQLARTADKMTSSGNKITRYNSSNASASAVDYERSIRGQLLYVASQLKENGGTQDKKTVAYLYAIDGDTGYFFVPTAQTKGNDTGKADSSAKATPDSDYAANNSTINMGYMATLPFVTNTFTGGTKLNGGIVMKVEDIWKSNPANTVTKGKEVATTLKGVDVIIYNSTKYTGYDASTEEGSKGKTQAGTNNGRNSSGVSNSAKLTDSVVKAWASNFGFTGVTIAGDDFGTSTQQNTAIESAPILYCARNYTCDKDVRAAWAFSKVFPELYGGNDDSTYAYWVEKVYHVKTAKVTSVVAAYTHQDAANVKIYDDNAAEIEAKAEAGYNWYTSLPSTSAYKTTMAYYTGSTRASYYDTAKKLTEAAESVGSEFNASTLASIQKASEITSNIVGIFAPSTLWTATHTKAQAIKVSPTSKAYKLATVKKAKQTLAVKVTGAKTTLTATPNAAAKKAKVTAKVNSKSKVTITVPKGTKKGTYKITIAAKSSNTYKASAAKTVTITVK